MGNMQRSSGTRLWSAVHPHTCGEHMPVSQPRVQVIGSSPHLWGTFLIITVTKCTSRFIPTPVGNIIVVCCSSTPTPVHPHTCGEHLRCSITMRSASGSSPHLWGTSKINTQQPNNIRFIPTPVGNIDNEKNKTQVYSVHPHTCGEH